MKVYEYGKKDAPTLMLLPGTLCDAWGNFSNVIPLLEKRFHILLVSYDGFNEDEQAEFPSMTEETEKIEQYIQEHLDGHIRCVYGCSLGGSLVGLLAARGNIRMDFGILGGSDLDQGSAFKAKMTVHLVMPFLYPIIHKGESALTRKMGRKNPEKVAMINKIFGGARPYVTKRTCINQFVSDYVTPLPDNIDNPNTQIHIFYALKMGEKYRERYLKHFVHPVIHELNTEHEELLMRNPEKWALLVSNIALQEV